MISTAFRVLFRGSQPARARETPPDNEELYLPKDFQVRFPQPQKLVVVGGGGSREYLGRRVNSFTRARDGWLEQRRPLKLLHRRKIKKTGFTAGFGYKNSLPRDHYRLRATLSKRMVVRVSRATRPGEAAGRSRLDAGRQ